MKLVSLVIPFYNEEEMASLFFEKLFESLNDVKDYSFELVCVNDGSKDNTLSLLKEAQKQYKNIRIVDLSRNFGHEPAVAAGLSVAKGDLIIPMDADLQDPPHVIPMLLKKYEEGYEVVNAKRSVRKSDSFLKRNTAKLFYKINYKWSGKVKTPKDVGHFRLMTRRVLDKVLELNEVNRVLRVEVPFVGFKTATVEYSRPEREKGETHYNYKSMIDLASDAIVSTSDKPLRMILKTTIVMFISSIFASFIFLILFILHLCKVRMAIGGFGLVVYFILLFMLILGTIVMFSLSLIAEYSGKTFKETQKRPFYIINEIIEGDK